MSYIPDRAAMKTVVDWDLTMILDQKNNRCSYGATIATVVDENAADSIVERARELFCQMVGAGG